MGSAALDLSAILWMLLWSLQMKITVTQWMQVTMFKTVEVPDGISLEDAYDFAFDNGEWEIAKIHDTKGADFEVEE
jgi:hypothetical protein